MASSAQQLSKLNSPYETYRGKELGARLKEGLCSDDEVRHRKFAEMYTRILDFPLHLGQHSGGMGDISGPSRRHRTPEPASMENRNIIQWNKTTVHAEDRKGRPVWVRMMAVLRDSITLIREHHREDLSLYKIPYDDPSVFDALQNADTVGMFQVESRAQIAFLPKSKPRTFYDIVVQVAIIRPGPIVGKMLQAYIKRRQGLEPVDYMHPRLVVTKKGVTGIWKDLPLPVLDLSEVAWQK